MRELIQIFKQTAQGTVPVQAGAGCNSPLRSNSLNRRATDQWAPTTVNTQVFFYIDSVAGAQIETFSTLDNCKKHIESFGYNGNSDGEIICDGKVVASYTSRESGIKWVHYKYGQLNCMDFIELAYQSFSKINWNLDALPIDLLDARKKANRLSFVIENEDTVTITLYRD
jgi:hypothetical protein